MNGYPLLYPDSIGYVHDGRSTAAAIFLHRLAGYTAQRSEIYSLGIFPFHWNVSPWPIVALNAVLTAWVLWLVVRSLLLGPRIRAYLGLAATLSAFTSVSWFVSLLMPDILGALLYLAIFLLVFAHEALSRVDRWGLCVLSVWAIASHATHLMLAAGLCLLLALLVALRWRPVVGRGRAVASIATLLFLAAALQAALHGYLYGRPSLDGNRPPYLMARIVADGPGATYLRQHCATLPWAICASVGRLPDNDDDFLWDPAGIWATADPPSRRRLLAEEMPLVLATLHAYPAQQAAASLGNFSRQLNDFGVDDFDNNDWMEHALETAFPGSRSRYLGTLQARSVVPSHGFTVLQRWVVFACAGTLIVLLPGLVRRRSDRMLGLIAVVVPALLANAFVTAVLSSSDARYQARVIWLLPLTAMLALVATRQAAST